MTRSKFAVAVLSLFAVPACGQLAGPTLGIVSSASGTQLRALLGIPGSSVMGPPLEMSVAVNVLSISPGQDYALAVPAAGGAPLVVRFAALPLIGTSLDDSLPQPDVAVIGPGGGSAALYNRAAGTLDVIQGLPNAPVSAAHYEVAAGTRLTALAVSDDGALVLASVDGGAVVLYTAGESRFVTALAQTTALAFLRGGHDAVLGDAGQRVVYLVRDVGGTNEMHLLAGEEDGILAPAAVVASKDGSRIWAAHPAARRVVEIDLTGGSIKVIECVCSPSRLQPLAGTNVFQLTEADAQPLWLLDAASSDARVLFVPTVSGGTQ